MIKLILRLNQKHGYLFVIFLTFLLMAWDIGNLDALRQGTEGFYLQISKEMNSAGSFLTPLFRGEPHWSKPPLHFWLPFPLYATGAFDVTTAARLAILLLSIASIALCANWVERFFSISKITSALFFFSTIGFAKYSRIYMMEMPLSLLSTLGAMYLFAAIEHSKRLDWIIATIFCSLAVLVKGPVAWVMIGASISLYLFLRYRSKLPIPYKSLLLFSISTLTFGSLWFVACYLKYGQEFIDYFFLRENLGKFTSKSYPIRVVFQGLLIFSLPWSLYLPLLMSKQSWVSRLQKSEPKYWARIFTIICFCIFFGLWLIPNQRSHHYAMPSIFFFLTILLDTMKCHHRPIGGWQSKTSHLLSAGLFFFLLPLLFITFAFPSLFESLSHISIMTTAIALTIFAFISFTKILSLKTRALSSLLCFGFIWSFVTPLFVLPTVPDRVIKVIGTQPISVVYRKPYFIAEALDRTDLNIVGAHEISSRIGQLDGLLFIPERVVEQFQLGSQVEVLERWRVWQKSRRLKHVLSAINDSNLNVLQESFLLVRIKR
tara:strand:+ start:8767 stop:10401 length:1635 start_codon:yes stop_codon:yes gene_type:complete